MKYPSDVPSSRFSWDGERKHPDCGFAELLKPPRMANHTVRRKAPGPTGAGAGGNIRERVPSPSGIGLFRFGSGN